MEGSMNKSKRPQGLFSPAQFRTQIQKPTQPQSSSLSAWLFGIFALQAPLTFAETSVSAVTEQLQQAIEQGQAFPPAQIQQVSGDTASMAVVDLNAMALDT